MRWSRFVRLIWITCMVSLVNMLLTPRSGLNKALSVITCTIFSFDSTFCNINGLSSGKTLATEIPVLLAQNISRKTYNTPTVRGVPIDATVWENDSTPLNEQAAVQESANLFCKWQGYNYADSWSVGKNERITIENGTYRFNRNTVSHPTYCDFCRWHFSSVSCVTRQVASNNESFQISQSGRNIGGIPVSGTRVPPLDEFDIVMTQFMRKHNIRAGTLAISKNTPNGPAQIIFSHGYGYSDRQQRNIISPNVLMRVASVDKPITNAAINQLIRQGRLSSNTKVFPLLGITEIADRRFNDITVKNLQDHRWWEGVHHYPHDNLIEVAQMLGVPSPPSTLDIARYIAMRPLKYTPGTQGDYCGFCYDLLREVVEKVSGKTIVQFLREDLGMRDVARAYALPADRDPREIWYSDPRQCRNLYNPKSRNLVPCPDGGVAIWGTTFITSSPTLADFLSRYWIDGNPRSSGDVGATFTFFGGWVGIFAMIRQRADGINIAVLFNQVTDSSGEDYSKIYDLLDEVANRISNRL